MTETCGVKWNTCSSKY